MLGKKIPTILALLLLGVAIGAGYYFFSKSQIAVNPEEIPNNIKITNIADNKFSVSWTTKSATIGNVEYGVSGEKLGGSAGDDKGNSKYKTHHITISKLQPNTQYNFRILSGEPTNRFDNKGLPYTVVTGPVISTVPVAKNLYGEVTGTNEDTLVYITLPGAYPASTTLKNNGAYNISISTIRTNDLKNYITYDPAATVVGITLDDGKGSTQVSASTANITPVPKITMGKNEDFRNAFTPTVAEVDSNFAEIIVGSPMPQSVQIFNVEPLSADINVVVDGKATITNPSTEGEVLTTTKPEFRGNGEESSTITIAISGQKAVSDTVKVDSNGEWRWTPPIELKTGKQKITVSYMDTNDKAQKIERSFSITTTKVDSVPALVATSSAMATPRIAMPATNSGVPVTGVMTHTIATGIMAAIMMVTGLLMFAL